MNHNIVCVCVQAIFQETLPNQQRDFQQSQPQRPEVGHRDIWQYDLIKKNYICLYMLMLIIFSKGSDICVLSAAAQIHPVLTYIL